MTQGGITTTMVPYAIFKNINRKLKKSVYSKLVTQSYPIPPLLPQNTRLDMYVTLWKWGYVNT